MFGIIILFTLVFIISFVNYWWGVFKSKEERHSIAQFIKRFEVTSDEDGYKKLLDEFAVPSESLGLLAHSYSKSGDYEKAIGIYLLALKRVKDRDEKQYILTELGKTYFKAGFLRRSAEVFLEALRLYPRNQEALKYLTVSYEKLKEYDRSLEALDALEEMGVDTAIQKDYLKARKVLSDESATFSQKESVLKELSKRFSPAKRMLLELWIEHARAIPWDEVAQFDPMEVMDLIWYMDPSAINVKAFKNPIFLALLKAKGLNVKSSNKSLFELDVLGILRDNNYKEAGLSFEFTCQNCKQTFPIHFYRCPVCHTLGSGKIEPIITKERLETSLPF
jgi:lipopolysaccharide biosynthesis regulator YciM